VGELSRVVGREVGEEAERGRKARAVDAGPLRAGGGNGAQLARELMGVLQAGGLAGEAGLPDSGACAGVGIARVSEVSCEGVARVDAMAEAGAGGVAVAVQAGGAGTVELPELLRKRVRK